jgi:hypothetical protein
VGENSLHVPGTCHSDQHCRAHDGHTPYPTSRPLCDACLTDAGRDIRALLWDYLDLAQLHEPALSQASNEHTTGSGEAPMPIAGHVDALQAEIVHAVSLWEHALRAVDRLHNPRTFTPLWRTTVYDHLDLNHGAGTLRKARAGHTVQRAITVIAARLDRLAGLPETTVCPAGIDDEPGRMSGWQAIHHLQALHQRARGMLGRTTRRFWIPGECWDTAGCGGHPKPGEDGPLFRSEPKKFEDPMQVHCARCGAYRAYADYEHYQAKLLWPTQATDDLVRVTA